MKNLKQCTKCGRWKKFAEFNKSSQALSGLRPNCRKCQQAQDNKRYKQHKKGDTTSPKKRVRKKKPPVLKICKACGGKYKPAKWHDKQRLLRLASQYCGDKCFVRTEVKKTPVIYYDLNTKEAAILLKKTLLEKFGVINTKAVKWDDETIELVGLREEETRKFRKTYRRFPSEKGSK